MNDISTWLPAVGSSSAALVAMWFFLAYLTKRDERQSKEMEALVSRMESIANNSHAQMTSVKDDFVAVTREGRDQQRQSNEALFLLSREMVQTMVQMSTRVSELAVAIHELRNQPQQRPHGGNSPPPSDPFSKV